MTDWSAWIGRTAEQADTLTPALLQRFRATLDSDGAGEGAGNVAAQAIHWCLCLPDAATATLGNDGHPLRTDTPDSFLPPIPLPRRMWAASKVAFHAPIGVGAAIARQSTVAAITEKNGATGQLIFVDIDHATLADGVLAVNERQTVVYRAAPTGPTVSAPPALAIDASVIAAQWPVLRTITPHEPLLFRYSALTFNSHRIHYDAPYTMGVEGYPALVVHGPLIATLLLDLAQRACGVNALVSFNFRAAAPAFVGQPLHLALRQDGQALTLAAIGTDGVTRMSADATLA